ncbi:MAG: hypothetical protein ABR874_09525 [Candidatus Sulfotelmatobacter sp.]
MRAFFWVTTLMVAGLGGAALGQETNFSTGPQYLMNGSPLFARSLSTPSTSLAGPPLEIGASNATSDLAAGADAQTSVPPSPDAFPVADLYPIYYGVAPVQEIEMSFSPSSISLSAPPASILDTGVDQLTTAQALRERGYGVTLGEAAAYCKGQMQHATRVYTNADIERLHGG